MKTDEFETYIKRYCDSRPKGDKHHFCITDKNAKSCSPMMLYGTTVGKMFFQGAPRILRSGASVLPFHSSIKEKIIVKAYPKMVAKKLIGKSAYKSDKKQNQSEEQKKVSY